MPSSPRCWGRRRYENERYAGAFFKKPPGSRGNFLKEVPLHGGLWGSAPNPSRTLISRNRRFRQRRGKIVLLSHTIQNPRPAAFWTSSDRPHSAQTVTQDCHYEEKLSPLLQRRRDKRLRSATIPLGGCTHKMPLLPTPKKQTVEIRNYPSSWVYRQIKAVTNTEGKAQ